MPTEDLSYLGGVDHPHHAPPHPHHHPQQQQHRRYYSSGGGDGPKALPAGGRPSSSAGGSASPAATAGTAAPPRTTAMSRRGGRTRSRSPPVLSSGGRLSLVGDNNHPNHPASPNSPVAPPSSHHHQHHLHPDNPSSAAAAAAAAAKAFSSNHNSGGGGSGNSSSRQPPPPGSWPEGGSSGSSSRRHHHHHGGEEPGGYRGGYDTKAPVPPYGTSSGHSWPGGSSDDPHRRGGGQYRYAPGGGDDDRNSSSGGGGGGYPPHRGSSSGGYYHHRGGTGGGGPPPQPSSDGRAYGGERESSSSRGHHPYDSHYRGSSSASSSLHHRGQYPPDYRYGRDAGGHASSSSKSSRSGGGGGTSLVIGGTTPIHVPKPLEAAPRSSPPNSSSSSSRSHRGGSASSVFRGRPGDNTSDPPRSSAAGGGSTAMANPALEDDSPQKILLSLRTPTSSFEESHKGPGGDRTTKTAGHHLLSPDDPPAIQNSHPRPSDPLFDRSPEVHKLAASIENAPSFSLFNQSFDSFGDGHYFNVDATLQNDSFGMVRAASVDADVATQILQSTSVGNFSQQLLASGSGALTLGYSPVNSFGNVSAAGGGGGGGPMARRSGSILVVGGSDGRATSPTQVLGMYRSYSAGGGGVAATAGSATSRPVPAAVGGPLDDSHLRMSVGSFGAPSMAFSRSYGEPSVAPSSYYYPGQSRSSHEAFDNSPSFHSFLRRHRNAFKDCIFLLPGLKAALSETPRNDGGEVRSSPNALDGTNKSLPSSSFGELSPQDTAIARRRVECSIFAFGGNPNRDRAATPSTRTEKSADRNSIFRGKDEADKTKSSASIVTPSSNGSPAPSRYHSRAKAKYEEGLPGRYYENESRLSWEFEESPPVEISRDEDNDSEREDGNTNSKSSVEGDNNDQDQSRQDGDESYCKPIGDSESASKRTTGSPQPKMRYRCKLCGQPKQNHTCPYQQSLARSIGIMVFPSVNAFTAAEPGTIAPALSDMNNFVDVQKEGGSNESSPHRPTPDRPHRRITTSGTVASTTQVTPESMRSSPRQIHSPISFATTPGPTPRRGGMMRPGGVHVSGRKRSYAHVTGSEDQCDLLFLEAMEIKPEQFRFVSPVNVSRAPDAYKYPSLPLPYAQRKRLSDNLFSLSNEVPKLTDECAQVLREAREKDMWDLAVAELMTQVIVIIHCPEGDSRFEGLRQYLLTLGIAC